MVINAVITDTVSYKRITLLIATMASFLTPFMSSSINVALPAIGKEFAMDAILLGWIPTVYLLASAVFMVPSGRIADICGRKKIFTYGVLVYTIASFFCRAFRFFFFTHRFQGVTGNRRCDDIQHCNSYLDFGFPTGRAGKSSGDKCCFHLFRSFFGTLFGRSPDPALWLEGYFLD